MSYDLSDYVDVAERISVLYDKWPNATLQAEATRLDDGWLVVAKVYRTPDDPCPGVGHAFQAVPGTTPYTRGSELENAETSAWGRAIVACGIPAKKIATRQDVERARAGAEPPAPAPAKPKREQFPIPASVVDAVNQPPTDNGQPGDIILHFGTNKGTRLGDLNERQIRWYATKWVPNPQYESAEDRRLKAAARTLAGLPMFEDDVPFQ